jgi:acyl-CoA thioester hydrolase
VYLSYFEAGRVEYLRRRGIDYTSWAAHGAHLPVVEALVRHRKTARFDDLLVIETRLTELTRVKVRFGYRVLREQLGREELVAEGHTLLACVGDDHVPRRLPNEATAALLSAETAPRAIDSV